MRLTVEVELWADPSQCFGEVVLRQGEAQSIRWRIAPCSSSEIASELCTVLKDAIGSLTLGSDGRFELRESGA